MTKYISDFGPTTATTRNVKGTLIPIEDVVEYKTVSKVVPVGKDGDYVLTEEVVEVSRFDRQEFVNSFEAETGINNILKRLALGDVTTLEAIKAKEGGLIDYTKIPEDPVELAKFINDAKQKYLNSGLNLGTPEQAAAKSNDEIQSYIEQLIAEKLAAQQSTEGGKE